MPWHRSLSFCQKFLPIISSGIGKWDSVNSTTYKDGTSGNSITTNKNSITYKGDMYKINRTTNIKIAVLPINKIMLKITV